MKKNNLLASILGFTIAYPHFIYLGVPIFRGRSKTNYLQHLADKNKTKLTTWKTSFLSMVGRLQLVKYVAYSILIHSIKIYDWPVKLLKDIEK